MQYPLGQIIEPLLAWYDQNARDLPWRQSPDPYRVWVSEIMLQQTRVEAVKRFYTRFLDRLPTIQSLADVSEQELLKLWEGLGYYTRARNLQKAAQLICSRYNGLFPTSYEAVLSLPGIGEYTAGAICSICLGLPTPAVDGNVLRVVARLTENDSDIASPTTKREITAQLAAIYPLTRCGDFTQSLMELGAIVCLPNQPPKCGECPLSALCKAYQSGTQQLLPIKSPKAERKIEQKTVLLLCCEGSLAIRKREEGGLLGGLYELPNLEGHVEEQELLRCLAKQGIAVQQLSALSPKKHIFTHIEWRMTRYLVNCQTQADGYLWVNGEKLRNELALPTAFKKLLDGAGLLL